jgi:hypothetical protein
LPANELIHFGEFLAAELAVAVGIEPIKEGDQIGHLRRQCDARFAAERRPASPSPATRPWPKAAEAKFIFARTAEAAAPSAAPAASFLRRLLGERLAGGARLTAQWIRECLPRRLPFGRFQAAVAIEIELCEGLLPQGGPARPVRAERAARGLGHCGDGQKADRAKQKCQVPSTHVLCSFRPRPRRDFVSGPC